MHLMQKHLGVLRSVNLVRVRRNGRHRLYRTNAAAIRPLHEWTETFEPATAPAPAEPRERARRSADAPEAPIELTGPVNQKDSPRRMYDNDDRSRNRRPHTQNRTGNSRQSTHRRYLQQYAT